MIKNYALVCCLLIVSLSSFATAIPGGSYNVGSGQYYTTLSAAVSDINTNGISGAVKLILTDASYSISSSLVIQASAGTTSSYTLTIQPNLNTAVTISGSATAIFELNGVSYVTINGLNGTSSLTLQNTSTSTSSSVIWLASSTTGAKYNTIRNCTLKGNASTTTFAGIFCGGSTIGQNSYATASNDHNTYDNNVISKAQNGIYQLGQTSTVEPGTAITNNIFGSTTSGDGFSLSGVTIKYQSYSTISNNDIQNLIYSGSSTLTDGASVKINVGLYLFNCKNATVSANKIHNINFSGSTVRRCYGLSLESPSYNTSTSTANNVVYNNMIYNCNYSGTPASSSWELSGINENGGYGDQFYFNSVRLSGTYSTGTNYAAFSNGNGANTTASPVITLNNNILNLDAGISGGTSKFYCHYSKLTAIAGGSWNYNDFSGNDASGAGNFTGNLYVGFYAGSSQQTLSSWRTATGRDPAPSGSTKGSVGVNPIFNSTDLHLVDCSGENSGLDGQGKTISSPAITTDIDGDIRASYPSVPDIGADEFTSVLTVWTGATSTNWNTASNWSCGLVPTTTSDVFIPAATTYNATLFSNVEIQSIHIDKGATVNLNDHLFTLNTTYSGTGSLIGSALSKLWIKGAVDAGTIYFSNGTGQNQLLKLSLQAGSTLTLGNNLYIVGGSTGAYGTVTADGTLNSNGYLTLGSSINGTAMVANSAGSITGNVTVERFIPARRAWRFLTVPFSSSTQSINAAWQEGFQNDNYSQCNPTEYPGTPGYGTEITYVYSAGNGYDANTTSNTSIQYFQNTDWVAPSSTTGRLITQSPYCLFVRGDRTVCLSEGVSAPPNNTILRATGVLNQTGGTNSVTIPYSGSVGDGFFVGNPYASSIDVSDIFKGLRSSTNYGFDQTLYVWDPKLPGTYGDGAYVTWTSNTSGSGGIWAPTTDPATGNPGSYPPGSSNEPFIESGQAIMLVTTATNAQIQFQESDKATTQLQVFGNVIPKKQINPIAYINLLSADGISLVDGVAAVFQQNDYEMNSHNAKKRWNKGNNMSLHDNGQDLAIQFKKLYTADTLFLKLDAKPQSYALNLFLEEVPSYLVTSGYIIDDYLKTKIPLQLTAHHLYKFTTTSDTNSYKNRFKIILYFYDSSLISSSKILNLINKAGSFGLDVYPNPTQTDFIVLSSTPIGEGIYKIVIYDERGDLVKQEDFVSIQNTINLKIQLSKSWANGMYTVKLYNNKNILVGTTKFVMNR